MGNSGIATPSVIAFWESILKENQFLMGISTHALIVETINKLEKLEELEQKGRIKIQYRYPQWPL